MADRRIRPPKDKEALIVKLTKSDDSSATNGTFSTRADLLTFAAVYGFSKGSRIAFTESLETIRQEVFERHGHDTIMNLLALAATRDPKCLGKNPEAEDQRVTIFEEYANGGLERLRIELQGVDDPLGHILNMLNLERKGAQSDGEFDLASLLN